MSTSFDFWKMFAGLGIFLFGMHLLEDSVRNLSGRTFRRVIRSYTNGRFRAIGSGAFVTAILQSSSAVSLMVLAFVGAGVMTMENAIGVILGSNVGTTLTAWIVATLGFKIKIETFALPLVGCGGLGLILFNTHPKLFQLSRLFFGFGFLFLGLDYMKGSVDNIAQNFDITQLPDYGMLFYLLVGIILTAVMQASAATIAIALTALHTQLITFDMGAALVIGANIGTTITVLLGSIGGVQSKKRVAMSHLAFNVLTGVVAIVFVNQLVSMVALFINIAENSVVALALFHTLFNLIGVLLFLPFVRIFARFLSRIYPDRKMLLTIAINNTPTEITEAATAALRKEVYHLLQECQLYNLRLMKIDEKLVFDSDLPFESAGKKKQSSEKLYENIKLLHAEIFAFFSRLQTHKLDVTEAKELERIVYASRNIMNSTKNFKSIRKDMDEFDCSENSFIFRQYQLFRKRLVELYHDMARINEIEREDEQNRNLLTAFVHIEKADKKFIKETMTAVADRQIEEMEIASLLLANRLFTQACRMQVYGMKDLFHSLEQINNFDHALDVKEILEEENKIIKMTEVE